MASVFCKAFQESHPNRATRIRAFRGTTGVKARRTINDLSTPTANSGALIANANFQCPRTHQGSGGLRIKVDRAARSQEYESPHPYAGATGPRNSVCRPAQIDTEHTAEEVQLDAFDPADPGAMPNFLPD